MTDDKWIKLIGIAEHGFVTCGGLKVFVNG